jgi:hypothetical protein
MQPPPKLSKPPLSAAAWIVIACSVCCGLPMVIYMLSPAGRQSIIEQEAEQQAESAKIQKQEDISEAQRGSRQIRAGQRRKETMGSGRRSTRKEWGVRRLCLSRPHDDHAFFVHNHQHERPRGERNRGSDLRPLRRNCDGLCRKPRRATACVGFGVWSSINKQNGHRVTGGRDPKRY